MRVYAGTEIPLQAVTLPEALREFANYTRQHLAAGRNAELFIAIAEPGARANAVLARSLPHETKQFAIGRLSVGPQLTAAKFREAIASGKPKRTHSQVRVSTSTFSDVFVLIEELAKALPPSGRGVMFMLNLTGWSIASVARAIETDAGFSRYRHGARDISASIGMRFDALSLRDPVVAETIALVSEQLKLHFGKPMAYFPQESKTSAVSESTGTIDPRLRPPSPEEQLVVLLTFDEALARAADQIGIPPEELKTIPLLFSRSGAFDKRMQDVRAGKKENISLPSHLKRFVKEQFPGYEFDQADGEQIWFRKSTSQTLDFLLMFEKVHQWSLGKSFTLAFAVDFPNTRFGGMYTAGARKNIFWMFHSAWEERAWAYSTRAELEVALRGCAVFLRRVLPVIEEQCRQMLLPPPTTLPPGLIEHGALSARQAYQLVLPLARAWAPDVQLESVSSLSLLNIREQIGTALTENGRIGRHGGWSLKFLSKTLDRYCTYWVPHTGRIWWDFYPVIQGGIPKYSSVLQSDEWVDSTVVAPYVFDAVRRELAGFDVFDVWLALHDPKRYSGNFVWEAQCMSFRGTLTERRDLTMQIDCRSGAVLSSTASG